MRPATTMLFGGVIVTGTLLFASVANATCRGPSGLAPATTGSTATSAWQMPLENTADLAQGGDSSASDSIVGLWHVLFLTGATVFDEGFDLWNDGGTEILNDNAPPLPANGTGNICLGVFKRSGTRTFKLRHPYWSVDASGTLVGSAVILEDVTLARSGDRYTGHFESITYDLNGNVTSDVGGTLQAERIVPE